MRSCFVATKSPAHTREVQILYYHPSPPPYKIRFHMPRNRVQANLVSYQTTTTTTLTLDDTDLTASPDANTSPSSVAPLKIPPSRARRTLAARLAQRSQEANAQAENAVEAIGMSSEEDVESDESEDSEDEDEGAIEIRTPRRGGSVDEGRGKG